MTGAGLTLPQQDVPQEVRAGRRNRCGRRAARWRRRADTVTANAVDTIMALRVGAGPVRNRPRHVYLIQGWKVTDPEILAKLDV